MELGNLMKKENSIVMATSKPGSHTTAGCIEVTRQTSNLRLRWPWVDPSIWTDKMLTALENGAQGRKWYSLIDKVIRFETLTKAWELVRKNKGAAGIDNVTIERFSTGSIKYLRELQEELKNGTYKPLGVKRIFISKGGGKMRPLGIPTVKDRVAQTAVKLVIEPIFEKEFVSNSYGFRPNKGAKDALGKVDKLLKDGYTWVVDADLQSYFDTIPHELLMGKIKRYISDGRILQYIEGWLKQEIMQEGKSWNPVRGAAQGAVISPLLANLYLHDLDVLMNDFDFKMVRYADDFVVLCKTETEARRALKVVEFWTKEQQLTLHPDKTHMGNCLVEGQGFEFLGYRFEASKRWVRKKSIQKFRDKIRGLTKRTRSGSLKEIIEVVNRTVKGWYQYFKHINKWSMNTFDAFVRRRLRALLRQRNRRRGYGRSFRDHKEWPNTYFASRGLFTMAEVRALEIVSQSR